MTYDTQGRRVLHGHPSTWPQEVEQLRADVISHQVDNVKLRAALQQMVYETTCLSPEEHDGSHWCKISRECLAQAREALEATTAPHSATHSAKPDPSKGQTPETP